MRAHDVAHAFELAWGELQNGELIQAAEDVGFHLFITCDKNIRYQQDLQNRRIAILLLSTNHWPTILRHVSQIELAVDGILAGSYVEVDCGVFRPQNS